MRRYSRFDLGGGGAQRLGAGPRRRRGRAGGVGRPVHPLEEDLGRRGLRRRVRRGRSADLRAGGGGRQEEGVGPVRGAAQTLDRRADVRLVQQVPAFKQRLRE